MDAVECLSIFITEYEANTCYVSGILNSNVSVEILVCYIAIFVNTTLDRVTNLNSHNIAVFVETIHHHNHHVVFSTAVLAFVACVCLSLIDVETLVFN